MRWTVPVLLPLLSALPARAQSINVDFESANTPYGRPTPNYRGSGGAAGVWNSVSTVSQSTPCARTRSAAACRICRPRSPSIPALWSTMFAAASSRRGTAR